MSFGNKICVHGTIFELIKGQAKLGNIELRSICFGSIITTGKQELELETNSHSCRQAWENACKQVTIDFDLSSEWLKKRRLIFF